MMFANTNNGREEATPNARGTCPACNAPVFAKCGECNVWHWAHETICPIVHRPETTWHRIWKMRFPDECIEITVEDHRADVIHKNKVYEFQSAPMSPEDMLERETFWRGKGYDFIWIFDMRESEENLILRQYEGTTSYSFRWKWPKSRFNVIKVPFVFDFGEKQFIVKKIYWGEKVGGWGTKTLFFL